MTTKQDKKPVPFIKAADFIKQELTNVFSVNTEIYETPYNIDKNKVTRSLSETCEDAALCIAFEYMDGYWHYIDGNTTVTNRLKPRIDKLAKRLEREFLRKEEKEKQFEIGKNEALLKVSVIDLKEEIKCIEEIRIHVDNPKLLNIRDELDEWIFNTQPFNEVGLYTIKAEVEEVDCELYTSFMWDFELIDFKPLEK